eukprot:SAG31_NODE_2919_length_4912_cov_52.769790_4_plen_174_part_00
MGLTVFDKGSKPVATLLYSALASWRNEEDSGRKQSSLVVLTLASVGNPTVKLETKDAVRSWMQSCVGFSSIVYQDGFVPQAALLRALELSSVSASDAAATKEVGDSKESTLSTADLGSFIFEKAKSGSDEHGAREAEWVVIRQQQKSGGHALEFYKGATGQVLVHTSFSLEKI